MRIALIADIHGNLVALQAALVAIHTLNVDQIICLGDVASMGAQPRETLQLLAQHKIPSVMGNTDANLLDPPAMPDNANEFVRRFIEINAWCAAQLSEADRAFIRSFQPTIRTSLGNGQELLCFHGSPKSFDDIIRATTPDDLLDTFFEGVSARVLAGGHTHDQMLRRYQQAWLINSGSIGLPQAILADGSAYHPARAEFAVLDATEMQIHVSFHHTVYDLAPLLAAYQQSGMPHSDWFIGEWRYADGTH